MSRRTPDQKRARALQEETGWRYTECLRCVQSMTEDEIDLLIEQRKTDEHQQEDEEEDPIQVPPRSVFDTDR